MVVIPPVVVPPVVFPVVSLGAPAPVVVALDQALVRPYAVVNDGARGGERSGDGAYVPMVVE